MPASFPSRRSGSRPPVCWRGCKNRLPRGWRVISCYEAGPFGQASSTHRSNTLHGTSPQAHVRKARLKKLMPPSANIGTRENSANNPIQPKRLIMISDKRVHSRPNRYCVPILRPIQTQVSLNARVKAAWQRWRNRLRDCFNSLPASLLNSTCSAARTVCGRRR